MSLEMFIVSKKLAINEKDNLWFRLSEQEIKIILLIDINMDKEGDISRKCSNGGILSLSCIYNVYGQSVSYHCKHTTFTNKSIHTIITS